MDASVFRKADMRVAPARSTSMAHRAVRIEPDGAFREEVEFVGNGERLFSCRHLPVAASIRGGVLICSPLYADFMANYQREVALGRHLAARGIAVQRFHYRGTGNSDGRPEQITLGRMCDDALMVAEDFIRASGVTILSLVGTRWGALVAASVADQFPNASLVLWEPITDPHQYFREAFRSKLMRDAKQGIRTAANSGSMREQLETEGEVDLLGYPLHRALYDSVYAKTMVGSLTCGARPVLIVQFRADVGIQAGYSELASQLESRGFAVTVSAAGLAESWWFHRDDPAPWDSLLSMSTNWLMTVTKA